MSKDSIKCAPTSWFSRFILFIAILIFLDKRRPADSSERLNDCSLSDPNAVTQQCAASYDDAFFDDYALADDTRLECTRLANLDVFENKRVGDTRVGVYLAV